MESPCRRNGALFRKYAPLLDFIRRHEGTSRADITRASGLSATTVGYIVGRLERSGIVLPGDAAPPGDADFGRPPIPLRLNPDAAYFVGAVFSSERLCVALTDFLGRAVRERSHRFPPGVDRDEVLETLAGLVGETVAESGVPRKKIHAAGLGAPGVVDARAGTALGYRRIRRWENVALAQAVGAGLPFPFFVEHNSGCFALGEARAGCARNCDSVACVILRTGVSLGLAHRRGRAFPLSARSAGELGHMTVVPGGDECWCGNRGCLETVVSHWAFERRVEQLVRQGRLERPPDIGGMGELARSGHTAARELLEGMFACLGLGISNAVKLLGPEVVVLNGYFNVLGDLLLDGVKRSLAAHAGDMAAASRLVLSPNGDGIGAAGAAMMAADRLYEVPDAMPPRPRGAGNARSRKGRG